jgi:hypothetical protein
VFESLVPYAITAFLLLPIIFGGYRRYRRVKGGLEPPPRTRPLRGPAEWWRRAVILLTGLVAGLIIWEKLAAQHPAFWSMLPLAVAGGLALWAIAGWFTGANSTQ